MLTALPYCLQVLGMIPMAVNLHEAAHHNSNMQVT